MPTGYTAKVESGEITSLREFALTCARAFGACISMRESPSDAAIPDSFEPDTKHYDERIATAEAGIRRVEAMTEEEAEAACAAYNEETAASENDAISRREEENRRYDDMTEKVAGWACAEECRRLKEFMLEQIGISRHDMSYWTRSEPLSVAEWKEKTLSRYQQDIGFATKYREEEIKRTEGRNAWLKALRDSLPAE